MNRPSCRLAAVLAVVGGCASARIASRHGVGSVEERVFRSANDAPDRLHLPVWAVMQSGSLAAVVVLSALRARRPEDRRLAVTMAMVGTAVWGGVKLLKPAVGRGRPAHHLADVRVRGHEQSGLGYPSGHAAVSLTLALLSTSGRPTAERATALALSGVTGWARMYVGAHLPLDIVGGWAVGFLSGRAARVLTDTAGASRSSVAP